MCPRRPSAREAVLAADLAQLRVDDRQREGQLAEKLALKQRLDHSIAARQKLHPPGRSERVDMRTGLSKTRGAGSRALIIEALQQYEQLHDHRRRRARDRCWRPTRPPRSLERKAEEARSQFVAEQMQKLAEIERKRDRLVQELIKAQSRTDRTADEGADLRNRAAVERDDRRPGRDASGQSLLTIVPLDGPIEVEAMITNRDIGFVEAAAAGGRQGGRVSRSPATARSRRWSPRSRATRWTTARRRGSATSPARLGSKAARRRRRPDEQPRIPDVDHADPAQRCASTARTSR